MLFLGGTRKEGKNLKGEVGVGIKVVLFSSDSFQIRSNSKKHGAWKVEISNANNFEALKELIIPKLLPDDDTPLDYEGTEVTYRFPEYIPLEKANVLDDFVDEIIASCLPRGLSEDLFSKTIAEYQHGYPSAFAALIAAYLKRYSYVGDTLAALGVQDRFPKKGIDIEVSISCQNAIERFGEEIGSLFGEQPEQTFSITPSYLTLSEALDWTPKGKKKPGEFNLPLGLGGTGLQQMRGFNVQVFSSPEEYESLLLNTYGKSTASIEKYRSHLFDNINMIMLVIGHINDLSRYLPGGSRRIISCNGVVTDHSLNIIRGRNQLYVRCLDIVIDVNGKLNYGKTQITSTHLVHLVREFINDAYLQVLQTAAGKWVGRIPVRTPEEEVEHFVGRSELGLPDFTTRKEPHGENDLIGLFYELAGHGIFPEYRIFGLSQWERYDGRAAVLMDPDAPSMLDPKDDTRLKMIEFKLHARDIIRNFVLQQKDPHEVNLVIAWDEGTYNNPSYDFFEISESHVYEASRKSVFPHANWYIEDRHLGYEIQVILLKEIVEKLKEQMSTQGKPAD